MTTRTRRTPQREVRRWTLEEDQLLLRSIRAYPQNLHKCFMLVAEEIDRSESAVANRWYSKVSKKPDNMCFFTASPRHVSRNRKNGMGTESNGNIWRRLCAVLRSLVE